MNAPTHTDILAALSRMDTLAQAELLSRAWEQMLADASGDEHDALAFVTQAGQSVSTVEALDQAWADLRDLREDHRSSYQAERAAEAAEYRYKLNRDIAA